MAFRVEFNLPNLATGTEIIVDGLGVFKNGSTIEVDDNAADDFRNSHMWNEQPGPELLDAFKGTTGVTVTVIDESHEEE